MALAVSVTRGQYTGVVTFNGQVSGDDTVQIGHIVYTFKASPSSANEVDIGTDQDGSLQNLAAAINADSSGETGGGGAGAAYGTGTTAHPSVTASIDAANNELDIDARFAGAWSRGIAVAVSGVNLSAAGESLDDGSGTNGAGSIDDLLDALIARHQMNSLISSHLRALTDASDE